MATAIQKNGMKPLTNGSLNHVENVNNLNVNNLNGPDIHSDTKDVKLFEEQPQPQVEASEMESAPEIDIMINNVVCSFSVRCHLNLREIALNGSNVEYRRENGMITMKLRRPYTTASIWSSGKVTCTGATSEDQAKIAARRFARSLQKLGFKVRFNNFRVVNVLGTCCMPFAIKITSFSIHYKENADYEPELHPGVTYKVKDLRATLKIFSTGSVTVTAPNVASVQAAIEHIFPLVYEFRKERTAADEVALQMKKRGLGTGKRSREEFLHGANQMPDDTVRVAVRIRPLVQTEVEKGCQVCLDVVPGVPQIQIRGTEQAFTFNYVFASDISQEDFYKTRHKRNGNQ